MTNNQTPVKIVAAYTADAWEHVCPVIRISEPLQAAGFQVCHGAVWTGDSLEVDLGVISRANFVLLARDFPSRCARYGEVIEAARRLHKKIIYELDDLLVDLPATHPDVDHFLAMKPGVIQAVRDADAVTVSTPGLKEYLQPFNPNIFVLPNFLIDRFWKFPAVSAPEDIDAPVTIGYMGGHGHKPDLEWVEPVLERLFERYAGRVQLMFWGLRPPEKWLDRPNVRWTIPYLVDYEAFTQYFLAQSADILIAPLQDHLFNRCKSPLKFIEYSALGIPGIYADLPTYRELVRPGENGFLAATAEEWEKALVALIDDAELRVKMGRAAQQTVQATCLLSNNAYRWKAAYQQILEQPAAHDPLKELALQKQYLQAWYADVASGYVVEKKTRQSLEAENQRLRGELQHMTAQAESLREQIKGITDSKGWKMLQSLYGLRLKVLPRGSRREHYLRVVYRTLREGPGWLLGRGDTPALRQQAQEESRVNYDIQPGESARAPLFSIIARCPEYDGGEAARWLAASTFRSGEVVVWDPAEGRAWKAGSADAFPAGDFAALREGLRGKYVCFASADLLAQAPTFLEMNAAALETEGLAFTANVAWDALGLAQSLEAGKIPGCLVAAKEWINNALELDFTSCQADAFLAGKFILHQTGQADTPQPCQPAPAGWEFRAEGQAILGCRAGRGDLFPIRCSLHPVETVLRQDQAAIGKPPVLVLAQYLAIGGVEWEMLKLVEQLKDECTFVIASLERQAVTLGTTAEKFRALTPYVYPLADFLNPALNFSYLSGLIERFQPKTVYLASGCAWIYDTLPELRKRFPALRLVNQVRDSEYGWINRYDPPVVNSLNGHIAASQKAAEAYLQKGIQPGQVYRIEPGVDLGELDPRRYSAEAIGTMKSRLGLPKRRKIVAFIGRFSPQQRPMDFVELSRRNMADPSLHFLMVGDGPIGPAVEAYVRKNQPGNLTVRPFAQSASDIYAVMDALVLPSEYEATPLVVLEALAMGKPVVVTDVGNTREVVEYAGGGVVVSKAGDIKALSDGVHKVLAEPFDGARARAKIQERYSLEKAAARYRAAWLGETDG